jgi:hypothetical protein
MADFQDKLKVHSRKREDHIHHLRKVSLNPKKCFLSMNQGNLLGHIVCKEGIYIDLEIVKVINELNPLTSKKGVQSFLINCVQRFFPGYASIRKAIILLLKKE